MLNTFAIFCVIIILENEAEHTPRSLTQSLKGDRDMNKLEELSMFELLMIYIKREINCDDEKASDIAYEIYDKLDEMIHRHAED